MSMETYTAFVLFVIVMTGTPGAGNLTMMGIGQTVGYRAALPFLAGMIAGMVCLNALVGFGLGGLFMASPELAWAMKIGGMGYICHLGWKLLSMQLSEVGSHKRFSFMEGVILHSLNPKSWAMSVVGFSQLASPGMALSEQMMVFVPTFMLFQLLFHSMWGLAGVGIMRTLTSRKMRVGVNSVLVAAMVGATAYALFI